MLRCKRHSLSRWTRVEVKWVDSVHDGSGWQMLDEDDIAETRKQVLSTVSVGYVVEDHPDALTIVQSRSGDNVVDARMTIPRVAINSVEVLS